MDPNDIQARIDAFLKSLNISGFIIFGWQKNDQEFGVVSSYNEMPIPAAIKAVSFALHDLVQKTL